MRKITILLSILAVSIVFGFTAVAQSDDSDVVGEPDSTTLLAPRISIEETTVDLGVYLYDKEPSHQFELTNVGNAPMRVVVTKRSCGCMSDSVPSPPIIEPGKTGLIEVGYKPKEGREKIGAQSFTVTLSTNDPSRPELALTVKTRLVRQVEVLPRAIDFGSLAVRESAQNTFEINCYRDEITPAILSVESTSPLLSLRQRSFDEMEWGTRARYELVFKPGDHLGELRESVIVTSNDDEVPIVEIPVKATIPFPLEPTPRLILFGLVESEREVTKSVALASSDASTYDVARAVCADPRVTVAVESEPARDRWKLTATLSPGSIAEKSLKVKTKIEVFDSAGKKVSEIPVHAIIVKPRS